MTRLPGGFGSDPRVEDLRAEFVKWGLDRRGRRALAAELLGRLRARGARMDRDQKYRTSAALLALAPESRPQVRTLFRPSRDVNLAEALFTMSIVVWKEVRMKGGRKRVGWVLPLVVDHIRRSRADTRYSTFAMACLLGMHWPMDEALPILKRLARTAHFAVGRCEAVHGLGHFVEDGEGGPALIRFLQRIAKEDRDAGVRLRARMEVDSAKRR